MQTFCLLNGYLFVELSELQALKEEIFTLCDNLQLKGTILLGQEGINIALSGEKSHCLSAQSLLPKVPGLAELTLKVYPASFIPFTKLKVRIRPEIITLGEVVDARVGGQYLDPKELDAIQASDSPITILDTRNTYEIEHGSFKNSIHLDLDTFRELPFKAQQLSEELKNKPLLTVCTGGIRCEKAAIVLNNLGFKQVYQLKGGILSYFEHTDSQNYEGGCFVFDDREVVDTQFQAKKVPDSIGLNSES